MKIFNNVDENSLKVLILVFDLVVFKYNSYGENFMLYEFDLLVLGKRKEKEGDMMWYYCDGCIKVYVIFSGLIKYK